MAMMLGVLVFIGDTGLEFSGEYSRGIVRKLRMFAKNDYTDNFSRSEGRDDMRKG